MKPERFIKFQKKRKALNKTVKNKLNKLKTAGEPNEKKRTDQR